MVEAQRTRKVCMRAALRLQQRYYGDYFGLWARQTADRKAAASREANSVDVGVFDGVMQEYEQKKLEWEQRWQQMQAELADSKGTVQSLRQQLEQSRARTAAEVEQAAGGTREALAAERQRNSQLEKTVAGLRAAVERLTKESTDHAYIQTVCEDTLVQLMDSNERLRREKQAWETAELQG